MNSKVINIPLLICFLLVSFSTSVWGMKTMTEREMERTTASYGVELFFDDYRQFLEFDKISGIDTDGLESQTGDRAALNINMMEFDLLRLDTLSTTTIHPTTTDSEGNEFDIQPTFKADFHKDGDGNISLFHDTDQISDFEPKGLSIDVVDELPAMSGASNFANNVAYDSDNYNTAGIYIGIPTMEFFVDELEIDYITMSSESTQIVNSHGNGASFGHLEAKDVQLDTLDGYVELAAHKGAGFDIMVNDGVLFGKIDQFTYYDENDDENTNKNLQIKNLQMDLLRIDAITHLDGSGNPASVEMGGPDSVSNQIHMSAGDQAGLNTKQADNYDFQSGNWQHQQPLSLDVTSSIPAMSAMEEDGDIVGMHVGLPTAEIYMDDLDMDLHAGEKKYGHLNLSGFDLAFLEGAVEISAHGVKDTGENGRGIDIAVDDVVAYASFDRLYFEEDFRRLQVNDFEADMLRMNAIALDSSDQFYSPGDNPVHFQGNNLDPVANSFQASPLRVDFSSKLPKMSAHNSEGNMAGIAIQLPTMELYSEQLGIRSITLNDSDGYAGNEGHSFTSVRIQGASHSSLGGGIEIAPH